MGLAQIKESLTRAPRIQACAQLPAPDADRIIALLDRLISRARP
jgi:nitrogen-specific signal transduction histidine kinase